MRLPLADRHAALGARTLERGGFEAPAAYGDPAAEALRARAAVGLADLSAAVLLRVTGADRVSFLHRIVSCDVKGLRPGEGAHGLLLTPKGKVVAEFRLAVLADRVEVHAPAAARPALERGLARLVVTDDVVLEDRAGRAGLLSLLGPRAEAAAARLLGAPPPALPEGGAADLDLEGLPATLFRRRRVGLPALDLLADAANLPAIFDAALAAARAEGGGPLGLDALDLLRVEAGVPALGAESGEDTLPQEAGLEDAVSFTKGCFLGQEPVGRLRTRGHTNRGLAGLRLPSGAAVPARGDEVRAGAAPAGTVTSAVLSPSLGVPVALALLRHEHAAPGTRLAVVSSGRTQEGEVVALPFFP